MIRPARLALCVVLSLLSAGRVHAQVAELAGRVVGPDGPVADLPVALHRVTPAGGATIDEAVTDREGRFSFTIDVQADSAVYFAATRVAGELFVGPPVRGAVPAEPYVIQVGTGQAVTPMPGTPTGPMAAPGTGDGDNGMVLVVFIVLGLLVAGVVTFAMWRTLGHPGNRRRLLVELAEVEEALAGGAGDADRRELEERRTGLRERLVGSG